MMMCRVPSVARVLLVALGSLLTPCVVQAYSTPLEVSPMVGKTYKTGARIWVGTRDTFGDVSTETLTLRVRKESACETCWVSSSEMSKVGTGSGYRSWKGTASNLVPGTRYVYRIFAAGYSGERGGSTFSTEPEAPMKFKVGVSSCMNAENTPAQPSFAIMHEQLNTGLGNFHMLIGDNMYTNQNPPTKDHFWYKYMQQRRVPEFALVYRNFPTFALWDDHDYGPNDEDGSYSQKDVAREAFESLWAHPDFPGAGIYHQFNWGGDVNGVGGVEFFMMDDRWSRDCPKNMSTDYPAKMYGLTQFDWLRNGLLASQATFKVIVNGSTLGNKCWGNQQQQLFNFIVNNKVGGVFFVTGDIHQSKVTQRTPVGGYPLWEVISSGIGQTSGLTPEYSFAILNFDLTLADPTVTFQVIQNPKKSSTLSGAGVSSTLTTVKRSQLQN
ncbi:MAG TPA: alkaline phosphatase D family protein [Archangium sp.]|nr:alkaline phosphatase D family protein [Archangium sp.]